MGGDLKTGIDGIVLVNNRHWPKNMDELDEPARTHYSQMRQDEGAFPLGLCDGGFASRVTDLLNWH
jgi:hypothetical protein